jgi:hypothetical protein
MVRSDRRGRAPLPPFRSTGRCAICRRSSSLSLLASPAARPRRGRRSHQSCLPDSTRPGTRRSGRAVSCRREGCASFLGSCAWLFAGYRRTQVIRPAPPQPSTTTCPAAVPLEPPQRHYPTSCGGACPAPAKVARRRAAGARPYHGGLRAVAHRLWGGGWPEGPAHRRGVWL